MTDRKIIPINTGKVKIGSAYVPKPCARQAVWWEHQTAPKRPYVRWVAYSLLALLALAVIATK